MIGIVFVMTGAMGIVLAYGYAKSYSLYIPIAIHLGWNFTHGFVFSQGSIGNGVFIISKQPIVTVSWFVWFLVVYFSVIVVLVINYILIRRRKQDVA